MIIPDDAIQHLADGVIVSFPVIAVAYFTARLPADGLDLATHEQVIAVPRPWRRFPLYALICVAHRPRRDRNLVFTDDFQFSFDRTMLIQIVAGLLSALAARVTTADERITRLFTGFATFLLALALNTILVFTSQMVAVRRNKTLARVDDDKVARATPFALLRRAVTIACVFVTLAVYLSGLVMTSSNP